jgi:hypothetical protein
MSRFDPRTGATIEVFYADRTLETFGSRGAGWFWWSRRRGCSPDGSPSGPFATSCAAYRHAMNQVTSRYRALRVHEPSILFVAGFVGRRSVRRRSVSVRPRRFATATVLKAIGEAGLANVKPRVKRFEGHNKVHRPNPARDFAAKVDQTIAG